MNTETTTLPPPIGKIAAAAGKSYPVRVCHAQRGFYIGTLDENGHPFSRESVEYYPNYGAAYSALHNQTWTQRSAP